MARVLHRLLFVKFISDLGGRYAIWVIARTQHAPGNVPEICRAGSKAGSLKYKLKASTNHPYCPTLRTLVPDSVVPEGVTCVYEIVVNGLTLDAVKNALKVGVTAAVDVPGVVKISSGNYGGKLGHYKAFLRDAIGAAAPEPIQTQPPKQKA